MPNYVISQTPHKVILRNFEGVITTYTEPKLYNPECHCDICTGKAQPKIRKTGVAALAEGVKQMSMEPTNLARRDRHHH